VRDRRAGRDVSRLARVVIPDDTDLRHDLETTDRRAMPNND
jgi:hypothetical protein